MKPSRVHRYIEKEYGRDCFQLDGRIKEECVDEAIDDLREECEEHRTEKCESLLRALQLAKR